MKKIKLTPLFGSLLCFVAVAAWACGNATTRIITPGNPDDIPPACGCPCPNACDYDVPEEDLTACHTVGWDTGSDRCEDGETEQVAYTRYTNGDCIGGWCFDADPTDGGFIEWQFPVLHGCIGG